MNTTTFINKQNKNETIDSYSRNAKQEHAILGSLPY